MFGIYSFVLIFLSIGFAEVTNTREMVVYQDADGKYRYRLYQRQHWKSISICWTGTGLYSAESAKPLRSFKALSDRRVATDASKRHPLFFRRNSFRIKFRAYFNPKPEPSCAFHHPRKRKTLKDRGAHIRKKDISFLPIIGNEATSLRRTWI